MKVSSMSLSSHNLTMPDEVTTDLRCLKYVWIRFVLSVLRKIFLKTGFLWPVFSRVRTESKNMRKPALWHIWRSVSKYNKQQVNQWFHKFPYGKSPNYRIIRAGDTRGRVSKQKLLKGCHQSQNVTVLAIVKRLEIKNFPCRPTMVANNTFQYSMAPPLWNAFRRPW